MKYRFFLFNFLLLSVWTGVFLSCKKKNQNDLPLITILSPSENAQFAWTDTISVLLQLSSENILQKVEVKLLDQNQIPVLSPQLQNISGNRWQGKILLPINRKVKSSGIYDLQVACYDKENNRSTAFKSVNVSISPAQTRGAIFLSVPPGNSYQAKTIRFDQSQNETFDLKTGFPKALVFQPNHRKAYYLGSNNSNIFSLDVLENTDKTFATSLSGLPFTYVSLLAHEEFIYASGYQGKIICYNADGNIFRNYEYQPGIYFPGNFAISSNRLLAIQIPISGSIYKLVCYDLQTGIGFQEFETTEQPVKIFYDGQNFFVYCNSINGNKLYRYNLNNNVLDPVLSVNFPIADITFTEPNRVIYTSDFGVRIFDTETYVSNTLINKFGLSQIEIDRETKTLYVLNKDHNQIEVYNLSNGSFITGYAAPSPELFALIKY